VLVQDLLEQVVVQVEHHIGVHLDEAAIAVEGEAAVARQLGQAFDRLVVEAQVQDRVHHAGHRRPGARTDRHQQGIGRVAEDLAGQVLDLGQPALDLLGQLGRIGLAVGVIVDAGLGGDGEARRHRQAQRAHLRQVGALAPQQVLHRGVAVRAAPAEGIDPAHALPAHHELRS
jgi:hypothetical protein